MRITIAAIGRLKHGADSTLFERYLDLAGKCARSHGLGSIDLIELTESRAASSAERREAESTTLLSQAKDNDYLIALDRTGTTLSSDAFGKRLADLRDQGTSRALFLVGGPDGQGRAMMHRADLLLSLGSMTLPHGLARIMIMEQIYRACTMMAGHPYHRS